MKRSQALGAARQLWAEPMTAPFCHSRIRRHAEAEARSRADLTHLQLLGPKALRIEILEKSEATPQHDRHDVHPQLVDQARPEQLLNQAGPAHHLNHLSPAAAFACSIADSMPSVTNVNFSCSFCLGETAGG